MSKIKLDKDEKEILNAFEQGKLKSVSNLKKEVAKHREVARKTLLKDKRVNIRMSSKDLEDLKGIAIEDGIPYQTLMSSILHKYVSGRLVEKPWSNNSTD